MTGYAPMPRKSATRVSFEAWENERRQPGMGWSADELTPNDPPLFSNEPNPFTEARFEAVEKELEKSNFWWQGEWAIDGAGVEPLDSDGWGYALAFPTPGCCHSLASELPTDLVRRRRWIRTAVLLEDVEALAAAKESLKPSMVPGGLTVEQLAARELAKAAAALGPPGGRKEEVEAKTGEEVEAKTGEEEDGGEVFLDAKPVEAQDAVVAPKEEEEVLVPAARAMCPSGLKWQLIGAEKPAYGAEKADKELLPNFSLSSKLEGKTHVVLTQEEWKGFAEELEDQLHKSADKIDPARGLSLYHFIKSGKGYFKPSVSKEELVVALDMWELRAKALVAKKAQLERGLETASFVLDVETATWWEWYKMKDALSSVEKQCEVAQARLAELHEGLDDAKPAWLVGRKVLADEMDNHLVGLPFSLFEISSGVGNQKVRCATLKAIVRVLEPDGELSAEDRASLRTLKQPSTYVLRLYVLGAVDLIPQDASEGTSDPYLVVEIGGQKISTRDRHLTDKKTDADFYETFEFTVALPGACLLRISCLDYDLIGQDDLIGSTSIDIEDRLLAPLWREQYALLPPVERRTLQSADSDLPQGQLSTILEILTPAEAAARPPLPVSKPEEQEWELRVICWSAKEVHQAGLDDSGMGDFYCEFSLGGGEKTRTDTHLRALGNKASWNWRLKFPLKLTDRMKGQRLQMQLWDMDIGANDCIGGATISLDSWFKRTFRRGKMESSYYEAPAPCEPVGVMDKLQPDSLGDAVSTALAEGMKLPEAAGDEPIKFWVPLASSAVPDQRMGKVLLSVELVPASESAARPNGQGRDKPNQFPELPPPVGRIKWTLNPFAMALRLLGPKYCAMCVCCFLLFLFVAALVWQMINDGPMAVLSMIIAIIMSLFKAAPVPVPKTRHVELDGYFQGAFNGEINNIASATAT